MYDTVKMLNRWFVENGDDLLRCDIDADVGYLLYAPYAAVSSWVPDQRYWGIEDHEIPRCGHQGFEEFSKSLQRDGYSFAMFELGPSAAEPHATCRALAIHAAFFNFDVDGEHNKWIEFQGQRVEMKLGSKTSGVLRIRQGRLESYVVKGKNEVEDIESDIRIQVGEQVVEQRGDFSSFDESPTSS